MINRIDLTQDEHNQIADATCDATMKAIILFIAQKRKMPHRSNEGDRRRAEAQGMARAFLMQAAMAICGSIGGSKEDVHELADNFMSIVRNHLDEN